MKIMKKILFILTLIMPSCLTYAQYSSNDYFGTWIYQSKDTVFTIKVQKTVMNVTWPKEEQVEFIVGGYSLNVKGVFTDNYMGDIPTVWKPTTRAQNSNIYFYGSYKEDGEKPFVTFFFFDQRKKHFNGEEAISGGRMELISPTQLHWTLNEKKGIIFKEGWVSELIGFSVPTDVIMTREELKPHIPKEPGVPITSPIIIKK